MIVTMYSDRDNVRIQLRLLLRRLKHDLYEEAMIYIFITFESPMTLCEQHIVSTSFLSNSTASYSVSVTEEVSLYSVLLAGVLCQMYVQ